MTNTLRITEIFFSLQGETRTAGLPSVFVRLTGCPLRCQYCDTAYAFSGGIIMTVKEILKQVASYNPAYVTVTGGEPLAQENCHELLSDLCDQGYEVSLETSGAMDISKVDSRVVKVLDLKTPGSAEVNRNMIANIDYLDNKDQVKFVICSEEDYQWSVDTMNKHALQEKVSDVLFSPSKDDLPARHLADWIVRDNLPVRFQMQLHKLLWDDEAGR